MAPLEVVDGIVTEVEYPSVETLTEVLTAYVDAGGSGTADQEFVADCAEQAVGYVQKKIGAATNVPASAYTGAVIAVGDQLFRRRRGWQTTDALNAPTLPPVRSDWTTVADPYLRPYLGPGIG